MRAGTTAADPFTGWIPRAAIQSSFGRHRGGTNRLTVNVGTAWNVRPIDRKSVLLDPIEERLVRLRLRESAADRATIATARARQLHSADPCPSWSY